jgi:hypothetical protein
MPYDLFEHRHRFSVWAAARATQRGFTSVEKLRDALQSTDIKAFTKDQAHEEITEQEFLKLHRIWCDDILEYLRSAGVLDPRFGRAAKLVAVYLKAMIVVGPHTDPPLARVAHPPIDRILLRGLANSADVPADAQDIFRTTNWTSLQANEYYALIRQIKDSVPHIVPFWRLERYWTVTQDPEP